MKRRKFLIYTGTGILSSILLRRPEILYADDLITDDNILKKLTEIYGKVKERSKEFEFEDRIDVDGDNIKDKVRFKLGEGSVTVGTNVTSGKRFELVFELGGWERKIYGIVGGAGKISLGKTRWLGSNDAEKYLDAVLQYFEEEIK